MRVQALAVWSLVVVGMCSFSAAQTAPPTPPARGAGGGSQFQSAGTYKPTPQEVQTLKAKLDKLNSALADLKKAGADDDLIVDAESCAWQADDIINVPGGAIDETYVGRVSTLLDQGLRRAQQIKDGTAAWQKIKGGSVNRAYRSKVDGTAQPYQLSVPASYDPSKPIPLYVYLHGRSHIDPDLGEGWAGGNDNPGGGGRGGGSYIRVNAFGRGNNSFRWAGETDVLEVIASVSKRYNVDPNRILLAGFSMGGAGGWQIGLHNPDLFCGLEVDAGVIGNRVSMDGMSAVQRAAQATYGIMIDHAINVFDVPLVGYAGANDAQLASSTAIRKQLTTAGYTIEQTSQYVGKGKDINALFLANPGQGHSHATGATAQLINAFNAENLKNGRIVPDHIKFVTYTTRYNRDFWISVDGLGESFSRAFVDAQRDSAKSSYTITTTNVSRLRLDDTAVAKTVAIDGDTVQISPAPSIVLTRDGGHWKTASADSNVGLRKQHALQGPVNDAFFDAFVCVAPSGQPFSAQTDAQAKKELARFEAMFKRDYCGDARTRPDTAVSADDIANNNLILFGDPGSNSLIAKIADKLPIKWTKDSIIVGDKTFTAADHMPVLIYPNPLNPAHYVVINAGLSAGGPGGGGTSYGDYAVLDLTKQGADQTALAGVFNESWQLPAAK
jgi:pimeloyl-ACP methyl ester carboxylesterase